jgi:hypothetical protein
MGDDSAKRNTPNRCLSPICLATFSSVITDSAVLKLGNSHSTSRLLDWSTMHQRPKSACRRG